MNRALIAASKGKPAVTRRVERPVEPEPEPQREELRIIAPVEVQRAIVDQLNDASYSVQDLSWAQAGSEQFPAISLKVNPEIREPMLRLLQRSGFGKYVGHLVSGLFLALLMTGDSGFARP